MLLTLHAMAHWVSVESVTLALGTFSQSSSLMFHWLYLIRDPRASAWNVLKIKQTSNIFLFNKYFWYKCWISCWMGKALSRGDLNSKCLQLASQLFGLRKWLFGNMQFFFWLGILAFWSSNHTSQHLVHVGGGWVQLDVIASSGFVPGCHNDSTHSGFWVGVMEASQTAHESFFGGLGEGSNQRPLTPQSETLPICSYNKHSTCSYASTTGCPINSVKSNFALRGTYLYPNAAKNGSYESQMREILCCYGIIVQF